MTIFRFLCQDFRVVLVGTNSNNSSNGGVFALNVNNSTGNDNTNISAQLCLFLKKYFWRKNPASGKTKSNASFSLVG